MREAKLFRSENLFVGNVEDGVLIVDLPTQRYYKLNETQAAIWKYSDGGRTVDQIAKAVSEEFDAGYEAVRGDVVRAVEDLVEKGLVVLGKDVKPSQYVKPQIVTLTAEDVMRSVMKRGIFVMRSFIGG